MGIVKSKLDVGRSLLVVVRNRGAASGATLTLHANQTIPLKNSYRKLQLIAKQFHILPTVICGIV